VAELAVAPLQLPETPVEVGVLLGGGPAGGTEAAGFKV